MEELSHSDEDIKGLPESMLEWHVRGCCLLLEGQEEGATAEQNRAAAHAPAQRHAMINAWKLHPPGDATRSLGRGHRTEDCCIWVCLPAVVVDCGVTGGLCLARRHGLLRGAGQGRLQGGQAAALPGQGGRAAPGDPRRRHQVVPDQVRRCAPSVHVRGESINETCRQVDMQCSCHKLARCKSGFRPHYGGLRYWLVPRTASFSCLVAPSVQESTGFLRSMCRR